MLSASECGAQINDRYEFPDELDLDAGDGRFLAADADRGVRNLFRLHSVLVHSGGVHGGHYYAFIRPDGKQWLKFDDDKARFCATPPVAQPGWLAAELSWWSCGGVDAGKQYVEQQCQLSGRGW